MSCDVEPGQGRLRHARSCIAIIFTSQSRCGGYLLQAKSNFGRKTAAQQHKMNTQRDATHLDIRNAVIRASSGQGGTLGLLRPHPAAALRTPGHGAYGRGLLQTASPR